MVKSWGAFRWNEERWLSRAMFFRPYRNQRFRVSIRRKTVGYSTLDFSFD